MTVSRVIPLVATGHFPRRKFIAKRGLLPRGGTARSYRRRPMVIIQGLVDRFLLLALLTALAVPLFVSEITAQVPQAPRLSGEPTKFPTPEELQELIYSPWTKICMK